MALLKAGSDQMLTLSYINNWTQTQCSLQLYLIGLIVFGLQDPVTNWIVKNNAYEDAFLKAVWTKLE